jgi:uncharacterized protein (DUF924 family)
MMAGMTTMPVEVPTEAVAVVEFWTAAGPERWFAKDDAFDREFCECFLSLHERAARGELDHWLDSATAALALILLLDQFPRNSFRGTPRMYATDQLAVHHADRAIACGYDRHVEPQLQPFFYLPLSHSESLADQDRSVALNERFGPEVSEHAIGHAVIVRRFGRFPHRNAILGRTSSEAELAFLREGGFAG